MTATAAKPGYGNGTGYANHGDYRVTHAGSIHGNLGYKSAKPPAGRAPKSEPEPSLPEAVSLRAGYLRAPKTLSGGVKIVVTRTVIQNMAYGLIGALAHVERSKPAPPPAPRPLIAPRDRQMPSAKAFTMHVEHLDFLKRVSAGDDAPITPETATLAKRAWQMIWLASGRAIPVPAACTGPDGKMFYSWDRGRHHLELEIIPGQDAEFFYRDRETGHLWGEDYRIGDPLPAEAVAKLRFFR